MSKENKISKEDVLEVANQLGFEPTEEEIVEVIKMYPSEQDADPTGTWNLVVEHCLSTLGVEQISEKQLLIDKVIERIKEDIPLTVFAEWVQ